MDSRLLKSTFSCRIAEPFHVKLRHGLKLEGEREREREREMELLENLCCHGFLR